MSIDIGHSMNQMIRLGELDRLLYLLWQLGNRTDGAVLGVFGTTHVLMRRCRSRDPQQRDRQGYSEHAAGLVPSRRPRPSHGSRLAIPIKRNPAERVMNV